MSLTLRGAASFFAVAPMAALFRGRESARPVKRTAARNATPAREPARNGAQRVEPTMRAAPAPQVAKAPSRVDLDRILAAARKAPVELVPIEWDGDAHETPAAAAPDASAATTLDNDPCGYDARCRRIRDRYIGARFPGVARCAADLESAERVVKSARLYFEDGEAETALELLDVAIEQNSRAAALWLAQLEIVFLGRDAQRYLECARAFRALHPASEAWGEVARLGRSLAPREQLFGPASGPRDHDHYGPWPDMPNWIQANWDLTAEVVAADFHRILKRRASRAKPQLAA